MQVVVLMGGLGTRLGECAHNRPKAMLEVNGVPFFDYQLRILKKWGFRKFLFLVGHQAKIIKDYYGNGDQRGLIIKYSCDGSKQLGTGGAICNAMEYLDDHFMLIYGDSFMDVNYFETLYRFYVSLQNGYRGLMVILKNNNKYDKSNVIFQQHQLMLYDKKNTISEMNYIDYGISILSKDDFRDYLDNKEFDLADILTKLSKEGKLAAQIVTKRFYEIGTPKSLEEFKKYAYERFDTMRKAVFLDRDGVINKLVYHDETEQLDSPFEPEQFEYIEGVLEALQLINKKGYYIFIVTNQPAAAKGKVKLEKLYDLNTWIMQDLQEKDIQIESINMCPHHPKGSALTREPYLIGECNCRKPKAGLITEVDQIYNIDWENSYMVGDSYTDILAGREAGIKTVFVGDYKCDVCNRLQFNKPDFIVKSLIEFALMLM